jgi:two-component system sensor histidine kinase/response regulator
MAVFRYLATALLAAVMSLGPAGAQGDAARTLRLGMPPDRPPFSYLPPDGVLEGQRVRLWDLMAERAGVTLQLVPIDQKGALEMLDAGEVDAVDLFAVDSVEGYETRIMAPEEQVRFAIFSRSLGGGRPLAETIGVVESSPCEAYISERGLAPTARYPNPQSVMFAVSTGQLDQFCLSEPTGVNLLIQAGLSADFSASAALVTSSTGTVSRRDDQRVAGLLDELFNAVSRDERLRLIEEWQRQDIDDAQGFSLRSFLLLLSALAVAALTLGIIAIFFRFRYWRATLLAQLTESKLESSEARFQALFGTSALPIALLRDGKFLTANAAAAKALDCASPNALVGRTLDDVGLRPLLKTGVGWVPNDPDGPDEERTTHVDMVRAGQDGRDILLDVMLTVVPGTDPPECFAILSDVTMQRQAEEMLRHYQTELEGAVSDRTQQLDERNEEQRAILDTAPFGIALVKQDVVVHANPHLAKQLQVDMDWLVGQPLSSFFRDTGALDKVHARHGAGEFTEVMRRADETDFWAQVRIAPVDATDPAKGEVWVIDDITAEHEADLSLRHAKDLADQTAKLKTDFISTLSHEIRTPLNSLIGFMELVTEGPLTEQQSSFLAKALKSGQHLAHIVNDVLDLSRAEAGRLVLEHVELDIAELAYSVFDSIAPALTGKEVEPVLDLSPDLPRRILGDPLRLRQILINFLSNAAKFTTQGEVVLSVTCGEGKLVFRVSDTGIGLSADQAQRLFTSFAQAEASTARLYGGSGLGLAIAKQLAALMGGSVGLTSEPGKGSEFWLELTLQTAEDSGALARPIGQLRKVHLSVANERLRGALCKALLACGYDVDCVAELPRSTDGVAVLDTGALRKAPEQTLEGLDPARVVFLTGLEGGTVPAGVKLVRKPVDPYRLAVLIAELFDGPRAVRRTTRSKPPASFHGARVLMADDDELNRELAAARLQKLGIIVKTVANGAEAVAAVEREWFDLVFMDHQMPVMDGIAATQGIRALGSLRGGMPIIAVTGTNRIEVRDACFEAGMNGFVFKPLSNDRLAEVLREHLPKGQAEGGE